MFTCQCPKKGADIGYQLIWGSHIILLFQALTFSGFRGSCLKTRMSGQVFKHLPRDSASVHAMKQTSVIVILAYFT